MQLYLLIFVLFLVQEPVSSGAALLEAYQYHYNLWVIHGLFVVATLLDTVVGYWLGAWLQGRFAESRIVRRLAQYAQSFSRLSGRVGDYVFLFIWGPVIFPASTLIAPWLDIPFWKTLVFLFLGDLVFWYGSEWLVVLGVKSAIPDPLGALYGVLIVFLAVGLFLRYLKNKK